MTKKLPEVLVFANDAGCGEIVGAYIAAHKHKYAFAAYAAGPAAKIFANKKIKFLPVVDSRAAIARIIKKHGSASFALLGTGWMTSIESTACAEAKKAGLKTAVYLESWGDFPARFGYPKKGWKQNLPDELWAGDRYALASAKKDFSPLPVKFVPNEYFKSALLRLKSVSTRKHKHILFLSRRGPESGDMFLALCEEFAQRPKPPRIAIRFHPADDARRFDSVIRQYAGKLTITKSQSADIVRDLAAASAVIGVETVAMAVSALAGIKTVSVLPAGAKGVIPVPGIKKTRDIRKAAKLI